MEEETCDCDEHGERPMTFVCRHITDAPHGTTVGFVCAEPLDDEDCPDAWCDACNAFLESRGGAWIDEEVEPPAGLSILCDLCYRRRRSAAGAAGRLTILRA